MNNTIDLSTTALVLIDLQRSNMARQLLPHTAAYVLRNAVSLADSFRRRQATVVFVRVLATEILDLPADIPFPKPTTPPAAAASELVPETGVQAGDIIVTKRQWGAFFGTDLDQHLRRRGVQTIVLGGIATNFGVESTARAAFDRGYQMIFAEDAMSSISAEAHEFSVRHLFPRIGRVRSSSQIIEALG